MERLTERDAQGWKVKDFTEILPAYWQACNRLAAYEDKIPFDRLDEAAALVKARDEGLVVVLDTPRKPLVWGDDDHETCLCPDCGVDLMGLHFEERMTLQCPVCGQYLDATKIITHAEAEAALGGGGNEA